MKILLANKFYYHRGGDCIHTIELEKLLKNNGHEVAIFSQYFDQNLDNEYSKYWPSKVDYSSKNISNIKETLFRPIYSKEVHGKFQKLVNDFKPDIVHLNNIHSQISPIIAKIAYRNDIPVVWTLHDYKLLCPSYSCLRDGEVCELCFNNKFNVIKHRCVKNLIGSFIAYLEAKKWNKDKLQKYTSLFIAPSRFMKRKMIQGGFNKNSITVINNFIDDDKILEEPVKKENYYLYFGRLSREKGVNTLLKAASRLPYKLKLVGTGPLLDRFKNNHKNNANIEFIGYKEWEELRNIIKKAQFFVIPSECYENNPLSVIESFALGTPVIGANIGGIPELIDEGRTGLIFQSGNQDDLQNKIEYFYDNLLDKNFGINTRDEANRRFIASRYYEKITHLYREVINAG